MSARDGNGDGSGAPVAEACGGPDETGGGLAGRLARGVCRRLADLGYGTLVEFRVGEGRRVDVIGLDRSGGFLIVEIKTSVADFRSDLKWPEYLPFCDLFYFAVPDGFPRDLLPDEHGVMIADGHDATILRPAPERRMNGTRRRAQILRFARTGSQRLRDLVDPRPGPRYGPRSGLRAWPG